MADHQHRRGGELLPPRHNLAATARPLALALLGGAVPVCAGDTRFTDDDKTVRAAAAAACAGCPLLDLCHAAGQTATHGVWGGQDRTPRASPGEEGHRPAATGAPPT